MLTLALATSLGVHQSLTSDKEVSGFPGGLILGGTASLDGLLHLIA